jgi:hypothetical protein
MPMMIQRPYFFIKLPLLTMIVLSYSNTPDRHKTFIFADRIIARACHLAIKGVE